jgi:hypothetical protein
MMAPDSQRVMLSLLGSVMAGTRPLGLMDSKGSGSARVCFVSHQIFLFVFLPFLVVFLLLSGLQERTARADQKGQKDMLMRVGFEPTPFRTSDCC